MPNRWPRRCAPAGACDGPTGNNGWPGRRAPAAEVRERNRMERNVAYIALFAALIAVLGLVPQITLMSGVPITAQSLGVMLCGAVLGARKGALAVLLFLVLVFLGLPLLSGDKLETRMKAVALERDKIRARERATPPLEPQMAGRPARPAAVPAAAVTRCISAMPQCTVTKQKRRPDRSGRPLVIRLAKP